MQNKPIFICPESGSKTDHYSHFLPVSPVWMLPRLRAAAYLYGMPTTLPDTARILDIGCGKGDLVLLLAQHYPKAEVVGLCNTGKDWEQASACWQFGRPENARFLLLEQQNALNEIGSFDYIFLRNQYGLQDDAGRQAILGFIHSLLNPEGLACVDYPVYPGAKSFEIIRDSVLMNLPDGTEEQMVGAAQASLSMFTEGGADHAGGGALQQEAVSFQHGLKEFGLKKVLSVEESPCYLVEFAGAISESGLACVGDAEPRKDLGQAYGQNVALVNKALALGRPELMRMQFLDFSTNRRRRHALLAHIDRTHGLPLSPRLDRLRDLRWASPFQRQGNGESSDGRVVYISLSGQMLQAIRPMMVALLDLLSIQWPASLSFDEILKDPAIHAARLDKSKESSEDELLHCLQQCFLQDILHFSYGSAPYDHVDGQGFNLLSNFLQAIRANEDEFPADGQNPLRIEHYNLFGSRIYSQWTEAEWDSVRLLMVRGLEMQPNLHHDDGTLQKPFPIRLLQHLEGLGVLQVDAEIRHQWLKHMLELTTYRGRYWVPFLRSVLVRGRMPGSAEGSLDWEPRFSQGTALPPQAVAAVGRVKDLLAKKNYGQAQQQAENLLSRYPDLLSLKYALVKTLLHYGKVKEAVPHLPGMLEEAGKNNVDVWLLTAQVLSSLEHYPGALMAAHRVSAMQPDNLEAIRMMASAFMKMFRHVEGVRYYRRLLEYAPDLIASHTNLSYALCEFGSPDEAVDVMLPCFEKNPEDFRIYGNLLYSVNYSVDRSAEEIFSFYKKFDQAALRAYGSSWKPHKNRKRWNRKLKVAYVSGDFWAHAVVRFVELLFRNHDHSAFEFTAYANHIKEDHVTERLKGYFDRWVSVIGMSDAEMADRIRSDEIDILVDLSGHTGNNRLPVFARKPAPVSVSWLGFVYTTGLSAIDYFLTDGEMAPQGSDHLFSEKPWRLPGSNYVFDFAFNAIGKVNDLPALTSGFVTFGSLTRSIRVNRNVIKTWARILHSVPNSRLLLNSSSYASEECRNILRQNFSQHGIDPERLLLGYDSPPWDLFRTVDIALDCFPHNSGTTLFDGLGLGIPFITLAGRPSVGRLGASILRGLGRPEWIAHSENEYVDKAVALANDLPALAQIRAGMRGEIERSELADGAAFARKLEEAYREMFRIWCEKGEQ